MLLKRCLRCWRNSPEVCSKLSCLLWNGHLEWTWRLFYNYFFLQFAALRMRMAKLGKKVIWEVRHLRRPGEEAKKCLQLSLLDILFLFFFLFLSGDPKNLYPYQAMWLSSSFYLWKKLQEKLGSTLNFSSYLTWFNGGGETAYFYCIDTKAFLIRAC